MARKYVFHPAAAQYPLMADDELGDLAESIRANGQFVAAVAIGSQIIDGRNRYLACEMLGIDCWVVEYEGDEPGIEATVEALNEHRRHLTQQWREAKRKERIERVAEARKGGKSLRTIAEEERVSLGQVQRDLAGSGVSPDTPEQSKGKDGKSYPARQPKDAPPADDVDAIPFGPPARTPAEEPVSDAPGDTQPDAMPPANGEATAEKCRPIDAWNIPIQPHAEAAFAPDVLEEFRRVAALLREAQKALTALADGPGGRHLLRRCQWVKSSSKAGGRWVLAALDNALREIDDARPAVTDCPYAFNDEREHTDRCPLCAGARWLGSPKGHQIPPALTKAMLAYYGVKEQEEAGA